MALGGNACHGAAHAENGFAVDERYIERTGFLGDTAQFGLNGFECPDKVFGGQIDPEIHQDLSR